MKVESAIDKRRAVRKYQDKAIPEDIILELLEAARKAPSAKNTQSHRYIILRGKDLKSEKLAGVFKQSFVCEAPLLIVCCADPTQYPQSTDVDDLPENYARIDLAIATAFLVLRATELGLGSVYVAWIYRDKIKKALHIPNHFIVPFVIPVGYPAEEPLPKPRKTLDEIVLK